VATRCVTLIDIRFLWRRPEGAEVRAEFVMEAWATLVRGCAGIGEQLRRLKWLAVWLIAKHSLELWLSALASETIKR